MHRAPWPWPQSLSPGVRRWRAKTLTFGKNKVQRVCSSALGCSMGRVVVRATDLPKMRYMRRTVLLHFSSSECGITSMGDHSRLAVCQQSTCTVHGTYFHSRPMTSCRNRADLPGSCDLSLPLAAPACPSAYRSSSPRDHFSSRLPPSSITHSSTFLHAFFPCASGPSPSSLFQEAQAGP